MEQQAIIYTRVSTGEQAENGTSLEVQEYACLRKAVELRAQVVATYSDPGISGALYLARPGIQAAVRDIEDGKAKLLIIYKLDRTGREVDALRDIRRRIERAGGQLVFADGMNFENNATGKLLFTQLGAFAEFEKELIHERTNGGKRKLAADGIQVCRTFSPFGYHIVTKADLIRAEFPGHKPGDYVIIEEQAKWVREMYRAYLSGKSLRGICRLLSENHVFAPRGGKVWVPISVKALLSNTVYKGQAVYGRHARRVDETRLAQGYKQPYFNVRRAEEEWLFIPVPAIVDEATWNAVQERLKTNQNTLGGNPERRFLLSGLLRCRHCGHSMSGGNCKGKGYYQCAKSRTYRSVGGHVCIRKSLRADEVESLLIRDLRTLASQPEQFDSALRTFHQKKKASSPEERTHCLKQLAELKKQEDATVRAQVDALAKGR
ncbi:recombinase family protein, partial [Nostoc sp. CHAB 5824]|nr:recombinase family protein [Nostoc sp. CHAB 5824]